MNHAVLLATHRARGVVRDEVESACRLLGARLVHFRRGERPAERAALVVSALRVGERSIPADAIEAARAGDDHAPIFLGTDEALVRPIVHLQDGRVVVAGSTASAARIGSIVRALIADAVGGVETSNGGWLGSTRLGRTTWSAAIASAARLESGDSTTSILVAFDGTSIDAHLVDSACTLSTSQDEETLAEVGRSFGESVGLVHYSAHTSTWLLYWPSDERPLWLHSPVRLPHTADLAALAVRSPTRWLRLRAQSSDLVVALSSRVLEREEMELAMADGGPALFDALRTRVRRAPFAGALVEVR